MILDFYPANHPDIYLNFIQKDQQQDLQRGSIQKKLIGDYKLQRARSRIVYDNPEPIYEDDVEELDEIEEEESEEQEDVKELRNEVPQKIKNAINDNRTRRRSKESQKDKINRDSKKNTQQLPKQEAKQRIDKTIDDIQPKDVNIQNKQ